jgi:aspartyl-tRNA(Asn)/glutamyl-tRNA(Gln) amidotransferase subunit B
LLLDKNKITEKVAQRLIEKLVSENIDVEKYVKEHDMAGTSDSNIIEAYCNEAIKENPKAVADFKAGKQEALNFLLGCVMRKSKGKADPKEVKEIIRKII